MRIDILTKHDLNPLIQDQISKLFRQLGGDKNQVALSEILEEKNQITLAYCSENTKIEGIAMMGTYKVISGKKGWIEDVVVQADSRGKGIGRKLITKLLEAAKQKNLSEILLFTEDHRTAAIQLYTQLGFKVKDSRIYTLKLN
ncbi:GNAT family N-acetyltransferase [Aquimarina sp. SS2-1]|uniref:GNAT family N-acetyltransferase n=1 Tax=Aquimarina besae TaxID=3342247 RepID=UPI003672CE58